MTWPATGQDDASAGRFHQSGLFLAVRLPAGAEAKRTVPAIIQPLDRCRQVERCACCAPVPAQSSGRRCSAFTRSPQRSSRTTSSGDERGWIQVSC